MPAFRITVALLLTTMAAASAAVPGAAAVPAGGGSERPGSWHRITLAAPIRQPAVDAIVAAGARGLRYRPHDSYLGWIAGDDVGRVARVPAVRNVVALSPADKVHPELDRAAVRGALLVHAYAPAVEGVAAGLERRWAVVARTPAEGDVAGLVVAADVSAATTIASQPDVLWVGPASGGLEPLDEIGDQIVAGNLTGTTTTPGYEAWLSGRGLDGSGVRVSIVDTGIDAHPDLASRIKARVNYSRSPTGEPLDIGGHGTHVAGIVGGDGAGLPVVGRVRDASGHLYGLGVAPKVEFVDQNAIATTSPPGLNCSGGWAPVGGWPVLTQGALANGAHIWNASWRTCEGAGIGYVGSSRNLDLLVRDGNPAAAGDQAFTMVFAAGNAGSAQRTIEAPSEAKNTIVVAASVNARGAGNPNSIAAFSSRGPAADGRMLPTISAPGQSVMSTRAFTGISCNVPAIDSFTLYSSCSGTSMAAPHVTGAVALLTQWWRRSSDGANPSPAMSKALLINSATDMPPADIPNRNEGWGRVNLGTLFGSTLPRVTLDQATLFTEPGDTQSLPIAVADPTQPLKVTLVWTDAAAAAGATPALVNDLDLSVMAEGGSTPFWGNRFTGGFSTGLGGPDRLNNIESVFIKEPGGTYTVNVTAANLPGDGVPSAGDATDQDFALVITNGTLIG